MLDLCVNKHRQVKVPAAALLLAICRFLSDLRDAEFFYDSDRVCDCFFLCKQKFEVITKDPFGVIYSTKYMLPDIS